MMVSCAFNFLDFIKKYKDIIYKTTNGQFGKEKSKGIKIFNLVETETGNGLNGKFTSHLLASGMWKHDGLNSAPDEQRYINGSKDWMDKLS